LIVLVFPVSHNLNFLNRPVRTRMPGGVAGERPLMADPYADRWAVWDLNPRPTD